ncbi:MAG: hypothetical protein AB1505_24835 [Candidatus Latescibacterota bacterium]
MTTKADTGNFYPMLQNCARDGLYPMESMRAAEAKIAGVYTGMGAPECFTCRYYDVPHSLTAQMQEEAFAWLEQWLQPGAAPPPPGGR